MHVWQSWQDAIDWAEKYALEDCTILASDWNINETSILKLERKPYSVVYFDAFYHGSIA